MKAMKAAGGFAGLLAVGLLLGACTMAGTRPGTARVAAVAAPDPAVAALVATADAGSAPSDAIAYASSGSTSLDALISRYAQHYDVPESLVRRVIVRESGYNPSARNGPYWGLMQISHPTARGMGYSGSPAGLLDAETNLRYAVRYLAGAYLVAGGNADRAVRFYASGYYYDAKRAGLLDETGLGRDR